MRSGVSTAANFFNQLSGVAGNVGTVLAADGKLGMAAKIANFTQMGLSAVGSLLGAIGNSLDEPVSPETIDIFMSYQTILETLSMFAKLGPVDWCTRDALGQMTRGGLTAQMKVLSVAIHARKAEIEAELILKADDDLLTFATSLVTPLGRHLDYMMAQIDIGNVEDDVSVLDKDQLQVEIDSAGNQIEVTRYLQALLEPVDPQVLEGTIHEREINVRKSNFGRVGTSVSGSGYSTCTFALSNQTVERMGLASTDYFNTGTSVPFNSTDFSAPTTTVNASYVNDNTIEQLFYNNVSSARDNIETLSLQFSGTRTKRKPFSTWATAANGSSPPDDGTFDAIEGFIMAKAADGSVTRTFFPTVIFEARPSDPTESEWAAQVALSDLVCVSTTKLFSFPSGQFTQVAQPSPGLDAVAVVFAASPGFLSGSLQNVRPLAVIPFQYRLIDSSHCAQPTSGTNGAVAGGIGCDQIESNMGVVTWKADFQVAADLRPDETLVVVPVLNPTNKLSTEHSNMLWGQRGPYAPAHSWPSRSRLPQYMAAFQADAPDAHAVFRFSSDSKLVYPLDSGAGLQWEQVPRDFEIASSDVPRDLTAIDNRSGLYVTWSFGTLEDYIKVLLPPRLSWESFVAGLKRVTGVGVNMSALELALMAANDSVVVGREPYSKREFIEFLLDAARITPRVCSDPGKE